MWMRMWVNVWYAILGNVVSERVFRCLLCNLFNISYICVCINISFVYSYTFHCLFIICNYHVHIRNWMV